MFNKKAKIGGGFPPQTDDKGRCKAKNTYLFSYING